MSRWTIAGCRECSIASRRLHLSPFPNFSLSPCFYHPSVLSPFLSSHFCRDNIIPLFSRSLRVVLFLSESLALSLAGVRGESSEQEKEGERGAKRPGERSGRRLGGREKSERGEKRGEGQKRKATGPVALTNEEIGSKKTNFRRRRDESISNRVS